MDISIFKKSTANVEQIDVQTAFNLWNLLKARYDSIKTAQMQSNFVHDRDLGLFLNLLLKHFQTQTEMLEQEGKKFRVKVPSRPAIDIKTSSRIDEVTDKFIYKTIFADMVMELMSLSNAVRTTLTNDRVRVMFKDFLISHLDDLELLVKFAKLKGWEEVAPGYKTTKQVKQEPLSIGEAYLIWQSVNDKYIQSQLNEFFLGFVHDADFKVILNSGLKTLAKQIKIMEQEALKYEIPVPERPPSSLQVPIDPETLEDSFIYQMVFKGIDDSIDMNLRAIIGSLRNDHMRKSFSNMFLAELEKQDGFLKYGKLKGWARIPPIYVEPT